MKDLLFAVTFLRVFLLAFQTKNVAGNHYLSAVLTTPLIAATDVAIILMAVDVGWWSIPWVASGGMLGMVAEMRAHNRMMKR